jgi:hypothetical protein
MGDEIEMRDMSGGSLQPEHDKMRNKLLSAPVDKA